MAAVGIGLTRVLPAQKGTLSKATDEPSPARLLSNYGLVYVPQPGASDGLLSWLRRLPVLTIKFPTWELLDASTSQTITGKMA